MGWVRPECASVEAVRDQVGKILGSTAFAGSKRLSQLLTFLVEQALEGRSFNEYSIAVDVFGKDESFDSCIDPVVRVHVGRLRNKLNQYRAAAGVKDAIEIVLPPRTYVPLIRMRPTPVLPRLAEPPRIQRNVAVRPFRCLSCEQKDEFLCAALVDELIHSLAKVKHLRVIPVEMLERGATAALSARELRDRFRADAVLDGNIRQTGSTVRIAAYLTSAVDGAIIWSEICERPIDDALPVQDYLANAILDALIEHRDGAPDDMPAYTFASNSDENARTQGDRFGARVQLPSALGA